MPDAHLPPRFARAQQQAACSAIIDASGSYSYRDLLKDSAAFAAELLQGGDDLGEARVGFLAAPGFPWVAMQWGIWRAGGIAVPLALGSPPAELEYYIDDTQASWLM